VLRSRGVSGPLLRRVTGLLFREQIAVTLSGFVRMLREYGADILADSPTVFDRAPAPGLY